MEEKNLFIINMNAARARKAARRLRRMNQSIVYCSSKKALAGIIRKNIKKGISRFVICGGDGTVNSFVNSYMSLKENERSRISLGILPCGKANDLSSILFNTNNRRKGLKLALAADREKVVDIISVNGKYFIIGGGIGILPEVVSETTSVLRRFRHAGIVLKDILYYLIVLKKTLFGYDGVDDFEIDGKKYAGKHAVVAVMNQHFIARRFFLSPGARNDDGALDICILPKKSILHDLKTFGLVTRGKHTILHGAIFLKRKKFVLRTQKKMVFVADGEVMCFDDEFRIEVLPKAIVLSH